MYDTLIEPKVQFDHLNDSNWCAIDCRASLTDPNVGRAAYVAGHVPRAVFADLATDLSGPLVAGVTGRHPLPDPAVLAGTFGRWGIDADTQVVVYDAANSVYAARAWWLLRWLGHAAVAVMNGGIAAWQSAGYPVRSGVEQRPARAFPVRPALTRIVTARDIVERGAALDLVDARAEARFRGEVEPIDPVAGHIPGARCLPFEANLDADNRFVSTDALHRRFGSRAAPEKQLVCYCGSGVSACHNILAMRHAGLPEAALYPGSFSEWIQDPNRPVER
jgi:thiosulfate/3-mercaptopyruvate sulfurtransferase